MSRNDLPDNPEELRSLYDQHGSLRALSRFLKCSEKAITARIRKHQIEYDHSRSNQKGKKNQFHKPEEKKEKIIKELTSEELVKIEKYKILSERSRKISKELARQAALNELIRDAYKETIIPVPYVPIHPPTLIFKNQQHEIESPVALLSDVHYGQTTKDYNVTIAEERTISWAHNIVRLTDQHRKSYRIDTLNIFDLGDNVDGFALYPNHQTGIDAIVIDQIHKVGVPILMRALLYLRNYFPGGIKMHCVRGNHGRVSKQHHERDNWDLFFYLHLQMALQNYPEIQIEIAEDDFWKIAEILGHRFLLLHGDPIKMWMNIPFYGVERSMNRWSQSIKQKRDTEDIERFLRDEEEKWDPETLQQLRDIISQPAGWDILCLGHFHQMSYLEMNAKTCFMNGGFPTDNEYVLRGLKLDNTRALQWFFGVHKTGIGWMHKLDLKKSWSTEEAEAA